MADTINYLTGNRNVANIDQVNMNDTSYAIKDTVSGISSNTIKFLDPGDNTKSKYIGLVRNEDGSFALTSEEYIKPKWNSATLSIGGKSNASYEYDSDISGTVTVTATTNGQPVSGTPTMTIGGTTLTVTGSAPTWTGTGSYTLANGSLISATVGSLTGTGTNPSTNTHDSTGTKTTNSIAKDQVGLGYTTSTNSNLTFSDNKKGGFIIGNMTKFAVKSTTKENFTEEFPVNDGEYLYIAIPSSWKVTEEQAVGGDSIAGAQGNKVGGGWIKTDQKVKTYTTEVEYDIFRSKGSTNHPKFAMDLR